MTTSMAPLSTTERVRIKAVETLSDDWYVLKKTTFDFLRSDGTWQQQSRETYDRGNGATILLYNLERRCGSYPAVPFSGVRKWSLRNVDRSRRGPARHGQSGRPDQGRGRRGNRQSLRPRAQDLRSVHESRFRYREALL